MKYYARYLEDVCCKHNNLLEEFPDSLNIIENFLFGGEKAKTTDKTLSNYIPFTSMINTFNGVRIESAEDIVDISAKKFGITLYKDKDSFVTLIEELQNLENKTIQTELRIALNKMLTFYLTLPTEKFETPYKVQTSNELSFTGFSQEF